MIKVHYISDLHLDFLNDRKDREACMEHYEQMFDKSKSIWMNDFDSAKIKDFRVEKEVLLILGDLCEERSFKRYVPMLERVCQQYDHVYYICGNHEHYHSNIPRTFKKINEQIAKSTILTEKFSLLENEVVKLSDELQIIFSTYWYSVNHPVDEFKVSKKMNDYHYIRRKDFRRIRYEDFEAEHKKSIDFIKNVLENSAIKTIIATHHATSPLCHKGTPYDNPDDWLGYSTVFPEKIGVMENVVACLHGHAHQEDSKVYRNEWDVNTYMNTIGYIYYEYNPAKPRFLNHLCF